jgi:hypothetical protein
MAMTAMMAVGAMVVMAVAAAVTMRVAAFVITTSLRQMMTTRVYRSRVCETSIWTRLINVEPRIVALAVSAATFLARILLGRTRITRGHHTRVDKTRIGGTRVGSTLVNVESRTVTLAGTLTLRAPTFVPAGRLSLARINQIRIYKTRINESGLGSALVDELGENLRGLRWVLTFHNNPEQTFDNSVRINFHEKDRLYCGSRCRSLR